MAKPNTPQNKHYDVIIVGGGMVGASLAVALLPLTKAPLNLKVCVIDAFQYNGKGQPSYDDRSIALSHGSSLIFKGMGLWRELQPNTSAIKKIHVSDRGHFGAARLCAEQENVAALGYLIESRVLGRLLHQRLKNTGIDLLIPAKITSLQQLNEQHVEIEITQDDETRYLSTSLLVGADGSHSKVRELSGITTTQSDYKQSAIIANVSTQKPHNNEAFERFTEHGPIALLPMSDNRNSLVWTHSTENGSANVDAVMNMNDVEFLSELDNAFGYRLGKFTKVGKRSVYPLSLLTADKNTANRTVIIGNASHTLHPVAGQGLNLALRDVAVLADLLAASCFNSAAGQKAPLKIKKITELLENYEKSRAQDLQSTIRYTDSLVRLFSNDNFLLGHTRAAGLIAIDRLLPMRKWITQQSMGINHRQARLARGLSLRVSP